jgi:hypothetical protein
MAVGRRIREEVRRFIPCVSLPSPTPWQMCVIGHDQKLLQVHVAFKCPVCMTHWLSSMQCIHVYSIVAGQCFIRNRPNRCENVGAGDSACNAPRACCRDRCSFQEAILRDLHLELRRLLELHGVETSAQKQHLLPETGFTSSSAMMQQQVRGQYQEPPPQMALAPPNFQPAARGYIPAGANLISFFALAGRVCNSAVFRA